jgi:inorganic pyrophosphatase
MHGLQITIETPKGAERSGTDSEGNTWSIEMQNHYGYIRRTEGNDGDHVDVFLGPHPTAELVYVVDQIDPATKNFDEHKVMCGFLTLADARKAYNSNYEKNWKGLGQITPVTMQQFREWLKDGSQMRPLSTQMFKIKKANDETSSELAVMILQNRGITRIVPPDYVDAR